MKNIIAALKMEIIIIGGCAALCAVIGGFVWLAYHASMVCFIILSFLAFFTLCYVAVITDNRR